VRFWTFSILPEVGFLLQLTLYGWINLTQNAGSAVLVVVVFVSTRRALRILTLSQSCKVTSLMVAQEMEASKEQAHERYG